ncbi:MAG: dihydrofolate reductase family protein [Gammaproteobacteria bacterium]|nr:dihydrofolate reductase family protein [Gammaproteobacteria bacterium]
MEWRCEAHGFMACSLDGFIAGPEGDLEWLQCVAQPDEDYGFGRFMSGMDALLMGRNTFEKVLGFSPWPYTIPVYVATHRPLPMAENVAGAISGSPSHMLQQLQAQGVRSLYVDGGQLLSQFLRAGLLSRLTISRVPVMLGSGIPLFDGQQGASQWHLEQSQSFASGLVQDTYRLRGASAG